MTSKGTIDIGTNLTKLREEQNMSMDELVSIMNEHGYRWTKTTLYKIEHGERRLLALEAYDLLDSLGLDAMKDMPLLYRKTSATPTEEADRKLMASAERLSTAWNEFREISDAHAQIINYEETHSNITSSQARTSHDMAAFLDDAFAKAVQAREKCTSISTETYLRNFPHPPTDDVAHGNPQLSDSAPENRDKSVQ